MIFLRAPRHASGTPAAIWKMDRPLIHRGELDCEWAGIFRTAWPRVLVTVDWDGNIDVPARQYPGSKPLPALHVPRAEYTVGLPKNTRAERPWCLRISLRTKTAGVTKLIVCGNTLDCCVHCTLRHAADLNYQALVLEDCCGCAESEARRLASPVLVLACIALVARALLRGWLHRARRARRMLE